LALESNKIQVEKIMNIAGGHHHQSSNTAVLNSARRKKLSPMDEKALEIVEARKLPSMASLAKPEKYPEGPEFIAERKFDEPNTSDSTEFSPENIISAIGDFERDANPETSATLDRIFEPYLGAEENKDLARALVDNVIKPVMSTASNVRKESFTKLFKAVLKRYFDIPRIKAILEPKKKPILSDRAYQGPKTAKVEKPQTSVVQEYINRQRRKSEASLALSA
jgi:hypothetical protein